MLPEIPHSKSGLNSLPPNTTNKHSSLNKYKEASNPNLKENKKAVENSYQDEDFYELNESLQPTKRSEKKQ